MKTKLVLSFLLLFHTFLFAQRAGYWQQAVDYKMDIDVDEKNYQYQGKMVLKYTNNSNQALEKVYFHLYYNAYQPGCMLDTRFTKIAVQDPRMTTNIAPLETPA